MSTLRPLHKHILFQFVDDCARTIHNQRHFREQTDWGFEIQGQEAFDISMKTARWGTVVAVGDEVTEISPGDEILIEPLMWSNGISFEGETIWQTDITKVLATR